MTIKTQRILAPLGLIASIALILVGLERSKPSRQTSASSTSTFNSGFWTLTGTVKLGTYREVSSLNQALVQTGSLRENPEVMDLINSPMFTVAKEEKTIDIVNISVGELGFTNAAPLKAIYDRARELGYALCPPEVGPQLRLQFFVQRDSPLYIAMEPITDSKGKLSIFLLSYVFGRNWIAAQPVGPYPIGTLSRFIFLRNK